MAADPPGGTQDASAQAAYRSALQEEKGAQARMNERTEPDEVIERGAVTLRRYRPDDLEALFGAVTESLDHLRPWMPWAADYSRQSAAGFLAKSARDWADGAEYNYAIITGGALAGGCGLM